MTRPEDLPLPDYQKRTQLFTAVSLIIALFLQPVTAFAFTYVMAGKRQPADTIVHPAGYTGKESTLKITVALHSDFEDLEPDLNFTLTQAVQIWNDLLVASSSLSPSIEVPAQGGTDIFGTMVHEMGHCLGLAHPALSPPPGTPTRGKKYTASTPGPNGKFDLDPGPDGVGGTRDDIRGDDENLSYFKRADNNPFTLPEDGVYDSTTYSLEPADLPSGSTFSAMGDRIVAVSDEYRLENIEALMVTGGSLKPGQVRRALGADDVAGIRFAMSGLDEIQGSADDYTLELEYIGVNDKADILIRFDGRSPFAAAQVAARKIEDNHFAIIPGRIIGYNPKPPGNRFWIAPAPEKISATVAPINERALSLRFPTEKGKRYAVSWPVGQLAEEETPEQIIVQYEGENLTPVSGTLFFFVATGSSSEVKIAFPSKAPDTAVFQCYHIAGKRLEL
ncbi:MAG: hypothetical protein P1U86_15690 [Verrucomicrobiales bacterium]|nr:hypothetical protein [Verrucomicrobiales bacterium]